MKYTKIEKVVILKKVSWIIRRLTEASLLLIGFGTGIIFVTIQEREELKQLKPTRACIVAHMHLNPDTSMEFCGPIVEDKLRKTI